MRAAYQASARQRSSGRARHRRSRVEETRPECGDVQKRRKVRNPQECLPLGTFCIQRCQKETGINVERWSLDCSAALMITWIGATSIRPSEASDCGLLPRPTGTRKPLARSSLSLHVLADPA